MRFNAKKCNIMHIGKQRHHRFYHINDEILSIVHDAKYLGVTLTDAMKWSNHASQVASKAHQRLGFVRRNLRGCPYKYRKTAYVSLVRPQMEYCASVWDPVLKQDSARLERVQRQAARWACGEYGVVSVSKLLKDLAWKELADRRRDQRLVLMHKIMHGNIAVPRENVDLEPTRRPRRCHNMAVIQPRAKFTNSPLWTSSIFRTIPEWNRLPAAVAEADTADQFKCRLAEMSH